MQRNAEVILLIVLLLFMMPVGLSFAQSDSSPAGQQVVFSKEKISLDLKGIDIVELFKLLSTRSGLNIVPTKSVSGRITLFLNNVTFEDALEVILVSQGLASERKGDIITVMTAQEYQNLYGQNYNEKRIVKTFQLTYAKPKDIFTALSNLKSNIGKVIVDEASGTVVVMDIPEKIALMEKMITELDRVPQSRIFDLKYAKATDMQTQLNNVITEGPGKVEIDERTNKVMVSDLPRKMDKIKRLVRAFDEEEKQVLIEAKIIQISLSDEFKMGVDWEAIFRKIHNLDFKGYFPQTLSSYQQVSIGTLADDDYTLTLNMLNSIGKTNILSAPRIAVLNGQEAKIMVGRREAYVTQTISQADVTTTTSEAIEYIDVGVKLNVTPTINKGGFVTMEIKPEVSSKVETLTTPSGSKIPIVESSEAETTVRVKDGSTIVIAGLIKEEDTRDDKRMPVPILSKLPIVGLLFGSRSRENKKTELVVFLTPRIISGETEIAGTIREQEAPRLKKQPKGLIE
jgi:type II secretory pathway component GspD/PulD (secretin)